MKVYIWNRLDGVTGNWHSDGGLVIIARSMAHVEKLLDGYLDVGIDKDPDLVLRIDKDQKVEERVTVFPDAGCC